MTRFVEWFAALSVGIDEIDAQHQAQIDLINALQAPIDDGLMRHLKHWLFDHTLQSDQDCSRFLLAAGALARHQRPSWATRTWDHLHSRGFKCWN